MAGEAGGSIHATRDAIEKLWNARVYDFYGISDIFGSCAAMCRERDELHIAEDHILVEVIDPETLEPVSEGERGENCLYSAAKDGQTDDPVSDRRYRYSQPKGMLLRQNSCQNQYHRTLG